MLPIMQVISFMMHLEYDLSEIESTFEELQRGELRVEDLYMALNLELPTRAMLELFHSKLSKWHSAYNVCLMRNEG